MLHTLPKVYLLRSESEYFTGDTSIDIHSLDGGRKVDLMDSCSGLTEV